MAISLSEAAAATGVNRSTIYRAWKSRRMSATRTDTGQIEVDPAELFRVFPPIAVHEAQTGAMHHGARADGADDNALHVSALETEVRLLREMLDALRRTATHGANRPPRWRPLCPRLFRLRPPLLRQRRAGRGGVDWRAKPAIRFDARVQRLPWRRRS
jgi:AcrR family transcriptional regulator